MLLNSRQELSAALPILSAINVDSSKDIFKDCFFRFAFFKKVLIV